MNASSVQASYTETYRPQFHFTPPVHWMNDPNGLVYDKGEYHLFYQYNPYGDQWGHMSWGHAVSKDLLHWTHLPVAIPEDPSGFMIFSGCVVADIQNTSGLAPKQQSDTYALVAVYTAYFGDDQPQRQHLAYSLDKGRTWKQYSRNPVLDIGKKDFRDPKIFWYKTHWIMVIALPTEHKVAFYRSKNLRDWKHLSDFGPAGKTDEIWECPDLYELPVSNQKGLTKWVLQLSTQFSMQYFIGHFDGTTFINDNPPDTLLRYDYGPDMYAAVTFNHAPFHRRISIGWMQNWQYRLTPTSPWRGAMTLPRMHSLKVFPQGVRLVQQLVPKFRNLRKPVLSLRNTSVPQVPVQYLSCAEIVLECSIQEADEFGIRVHKGGSDETCIGYRVADSTVFVDRTHSGQTDFHEQFAGRYEAPLHLSTNLVRLHILIDSCSVEVLAGDGQVSLTCLVFPKPENKAIEVYSHSTQQRIWKLDIWEIRSVWPSK